CQYAYVMPFTF
nr:immunoglobulin light chain junction region [Macaca mulatta]MOV63768.1 immunoglobulin light chain junction region [Macaca mulatta]MOV64998.1 immunoglobulin light chain junction region [Macaca mulatta]